ncbi:hypothetical protein BH10PSE7_BH10PSE7_43310 [soil metagenome]
MSEFQSMPAPPLGKDGLKAALRRARLTESAHFDAVLDIRDAGTLRLQVLKDELVPLVATYPDAAALFDLAVFAGDPPRLWIDLVTSVTMADDGRSFRLIQDTQGGRETLLETADRAEMTERLKQHIAHRLVARERVMAVPPRQPAIQGYSTGALILAWLSGFSIGALVLVIAGLLYARYSS